MRPCWLQPFFKFPQGFWSLHEVAGAQGLEAALENIYRVGSVVIDELLANWSLYEDEIPTAELLHR